MTKVVLVKNREGKFEYMEKDKWLKMGRLETPFYEFYGEKDI